VLEQLEVRCVPAAVPPGVFSQNFTSNTEFNVTNGVYEIAASVTVNPGVTLQVDPGVTLQIDPGVTLTVNGSLAVGSGATVQVADGSAGVSAGITLNGGNLEASGASFVRLNGANGSDATSLQVTGGGQLFLAGSQFSWDELTLAAGAGGAVYSSTFASTLALNSAATANISLNDLSSASTTVVASGATGSSITLFQEYWGTTNTAAIEAKITDSHTNSALPTVNFPQPLASLPSAAPTAVSATSATVPFSLSGQAVTLTANVTSGAGTVSEGTVTFTVLDASGHVVGHPIGGAVAGGMASASFFVPGGAAPGQYTVVAVYNGDTNFQGSVSISPATGQLTVGPMPTSVWVTSNPAVDFNPNPRQVTLTATVAGPPGVVNEGTVTFTVLGPDGSPVGNAVTSGTVSGGNASATFTIPAGQPIGDYPIQGVYNGGPDFQVSAQTESGVSIRQIQTRVSTSNMSVAYSPDAQSVTFTATVRDANNNPLTGGRVSFQVFANNIFVLVGPIVYGNVSNGVATAVFMLPGGTPANGGYFVMTNLFPASLKYANNASNFLLNVMPNATVTVAPNVTAVPGPNPQPVTLSAAVTSGGIAVNEGTVTFTVLTAGNVQVGTPVTGTVSGGNVSAAFTLPGGQSAGTYTIQAVYNAGPDYQTSSDAGHTLTVGRAATTVSGADATFSTDQGSTELPLSVSLTSPAGTPGQGTVTVTLFGAGNVPVGEPVTVAPSPNGTSAINYRLPAGLPAGKYTEQVVYTGGPGYLPSSDSSHQVTLVPAATATVADNASVGTSAKPRTVTLSATVTAVGGNANEGTVTFTILGANNAPVGSPVTSGALSGGRASAAYTLPAGTAAGTYTIQAVYNPGPDFLTSSDSAHTLAAGDTATATVAADTLIANSTQPATLTAVVTSDGVGVNEGTVTFTILDQNNVPVGSPVTSATVSNGQASAVFTYPAGTQHSPNTIRAVYNPGPDFQGSSDSTHLLYFGTVATTTVASNASVSSTPAPQTVTLTADVTSGGVGVNGGTVTFFLLGAGNVQVGVPVTSGTVAGGLASAVFTVPAGLPTGTYAVQADYFPGAGYLASLDATRTLTVAPANAVSVAASSASVPFGTGSQTVTLSAAVTGGGVGVNVGTVTFTVFAAGGAVVGSAVTSGTVSGGNASVTYTLPAGLTAGTYAVQAVYNPGPGIQTSSDSTQSLTVTAQATTTAASNVTAAFNPAGQTVTLSAAVTSGGVGVNEGTVTFAVLTAGGTQLNLPVTSAPLSAGNASASLTLPGSLTPGTYTVEAVYNPGPDYLTSSDSTHSLTIGQAPTTISITASPPINSVPIGDLSTLTATVTGASGSAVNEGTVTFTVLNSQNEEVATPATCVVLGGSATTIYRIPQGTGTVTVQAVYTPGPDYQASSSNTQTLEIGPAATTIVATSPTVAYSPNPQFVVLGATAENLGAPVGYEGTLTFSLLGPGNVQVGQPVTVGSTVDTFTDAFYPLPAGLGGGVYTVQIAYSGGPDYLPSNSSSATVTVTGAPSTTLASDASATFSPGSQAVTLSAGVTSGGAPVDGGTVTFSVFAAGNVQVGSPVTSGTVTGGSASAAFTLPAGQIPGTYTIVAAYSGNTLYGASTDNTRTLTVGPTSTLATTTAASPAAVPFSQGSQTVTLSAAVTSGGVGVNEGTVTFTVLAAGNVPVGTAVTSGTVSGGNASATFTVPAGQASGFYTIQAVYNPGPDYLTSSDATQTLIVGSAPTTTVVSNQTAPFDANPESVTLSAAVTSGGVGVNGGSVTFSVFAAGHVLVGTPVTSGTVAAGNASVSYGLPAALARGTYTIQAVYNSGPGYQTSSDSSHTLTVVAAPTTVSVIPVSLTFSAVAHSTVMNVSVLSAGLVNEGTVTVTVFTAGNVQVGTPATSGTLSQGNANVSYTIPAGEPPGTYKVQAVYNPGPDFQTSSFSSNNGLIIVRAVSTTTATSASAGFSPAAQSVTLSASVTSGGVGVNEGKVTFTVIDSAMNLIGTPVTSGTVSGGNASVSYTLPAGQAVGTYTVEASYDGGSDYLSSFDGTQPLTVVAGTTTTVAANATAVFSPNSQSVTLGASVTTAGGVAVDEGAVTFTVFGPGHVQVGAPVTSGALTSGAASASFTLPAGQAAGAYTVQAAYVPGADFNASSDSTHTLTVSPAATATVASNATATFSGNSQSLTLSANVTLAGSGANEGTVTFTVLAAGNVPVGSPVTSGTLSSGAASVSYTLPAGTAAGTYTIRAVYNPGADGTTSSDTSHTVTVSPATTVTAASGTTALFSPGTQFVTLSATVTSAAGGVNEGKVTFTVLNGQNVPVGNQVGGGAVTAGSAIATYSLPALPAGIYTIQAQYADASPADFTGSQDSTHSLLLQAATNTAAAAVAPLSFSESSTSLPLSASVTSAGGSVGEGAVMFLLVDSRNNVVGSPVTSGTVAGGLASATFVVPPGTPAGTYTVQARYSDGTSGLFLGSTDSTQLLTVQPAATTTVAASVVTAFSPSTQTLSFTSTVTSPAGPVGEGAVTFTVFSGSTMIGSPVTSGTVNGGAASASFNLPAGTPAGSYTIHARYADGSSTNLQGGDNSASPATLTVGQVPTVTSVSNSLIAGGAAAGAVTLHATVSSGAGVVNGGTVTFTLLQGNATVGTPVTSAAVSGGAASVSYTIPAGTPVGLYTIQASYGGGTNFASGTGTGQLTIDGPPTLPPINGGSPIVLPHNQFPESLPLGASSAVGLPLSYSATAAGDNPLFDLQQHYQFTALGTLTAGATAYVLHSNQPGPGVGGYYLLRPSDGALFGYDGSGSYAHTFANATPITTLGVNAYLDPTLLTNAQSPIDYATLFGLQQHYQFTGFGFVTAGVTAYVLHSNQPGPGVSGYYLIRSDGALFAYDGASSFAATFANGSPLAQLGATVYASPNDLLNATVSPALYAQLNQLQQQYDLQELNGSFFTNTYGHQAQWLYSPVLNPFGQHWYTLTLNSNGTQAILTAWQGYQDSAVGAVLATLDPGVYANPALLTGATAAPDPAVQTSVDGSGNLSLGLPAGYAGTFRLTLTASDGLLSASQSVMVTATDAAPTLGVGPGSNLIPPGGTQTVAHLSSQTDPVITNDADGDPVSVTAAVSAYSPAYALQMRYQFKGLGYFNNGGVSAYLLQAPAANPFGNPYYLLSTAGALYAYDGSGSYSHSFANGSPLASFGASFYADPTLLTSAQPAVDYATLYNLQQQYQFTGLGTLTVGATAYVLHSSQPGPGVGGYYLLAANGLLVPYDGSGSYAHAFANATPLATLDPGVFASPALLLNARATPGSYDQLFQLEQQYDLQEMGGSFYTGQFGNAAKWLYSPIANANNQHWYTLVPAAGGTQALLYAWDGGNNSVPAGAQPLAVLDSSVYADPTLLLNARAPQAPTGVSASVSGGVLTLSAPAAFVGTFRVTLTASDGVLSTTESFLVNSTDTPPVPDAIPAASASRSGAPVQVALGSTDAEGDAVTYTAQAVGYSPAYNLQQVYHFTGLGYVGVGGVTAYVMQSGVSGGASGYYLLKSDGGVYAYDGSGSYAHTFANANNLITTLDPSAYNTPTLLTNAQPPSAPAAVVSVVGNTLTVNVSAVPVGTVFQVIVSAFDGAEVVRSGFLVTVNP
jgi:hypothetical protein